MMTDSQCRGLAVTTPFTLREIESLRRSARHHVALRELEGVDVSHVVSYVVDRALESGVDPHSLIPAAVVDAANGSLPAATPIPHVNISREDALTLNQPFFPGVADAMRKLPLFRFVTWLNRKLTRQG